jgi:hypothetical protein
MTNKRVTMTGKVTGLPIQVEPYTIGTAEALKQTDKAILVEMQDGPLEDKQFWVPLSVISPDSEVTDEGDRGLLVTYKWWAKSNGYAED